MNDTLNLEGWQPEPSKKQPLQRIIDEAFDYRGYVTLFLWDGSEKVAYISNRNHNDPNPFIEIFDEDGNGPSEILMSEIKTIYFSGKDFATGKSWEAWQLKRNATSDKTQHADSSDPPKT